VDEIRIIGMNIRRYRQWKGWTQADLGLKVGLTKDTISKVELGKQNLNMRQLVSIQRELGVSPVELYLEDPEAVYLKLAFSGKDLERIDRITARLERLGILKGMSKK